MPVCSSDGKRLFANKCHARCAGVEDFIDCPGLNMVIPGKTPLPPNKELPLRLQTVGDQDLSSDDENLWFLMQRLRDSYKCILALNTVLYVQVKNATKCDVVLSFLYSVTLLFKTQSFHESRGEEKGSTTIA